MHELRWLHKLTLGTESKLKRGTCSLTDSDLPTLKQARVRVGGSTSSIVERQRGTHCGGTPIAD